LTYFHVNHEGSVMAMTDTAGNSSGCAAGVNCQRLAYDEYGNLSSISTGTGEPYRLTGRRFDAETGMYYYRARYYTPDLGRFMQMDPVGSKDDLKLYAYVGNDPLNESDPSGQYECGAPSGGMVYCTAHSEADAAAMCAYAVSKGWTLATVSTESNKEDLPTNSESSDSSTAAPKTLPTAATGSPPPDQEPNDEDRSRDREKRHSRERNETKRKSPENVKRGTEIAKLATRMSS
jgi:RHS repeat-associated protein